MLPFEPYLDAIKDGEVLAHGVLAVHHPVDPHGHRPDVAAILATDHLGQLDPAGRHAGQKRLAGSERLARAPVPDRPVDHEVVLAGAAENAPEGLGRPRPSAVFA